jgi:hypothetical protein
MNDFVRGFGDGWMQSLPRRLGSGLNQHQKVMMAARKTPER